MSALSTDGKKTINNRLCNTLKESMSDFQNKKNESSSFCTALVKADVWKNRTERMDEISKLTTRSFVNLTFHGGNSTFDFFDENCDVKTRNGSQTALNVSLDETKPDDHRGKKTYSNLGKKRRKQVFIYPCSDCIKIPEPSLSSDDIFKSAQRWEVPNVNDAGVENSCKTVFAKRLTVFNKLSSGLGIRKRTFSHVGYSKKISQITNSLFSANKYELFVDTARILFAMRRYCSETIAKRLQTIARCSFLVRNGLLRYLYGLYVFVDRVHLGNLENKRYRKNFILHLITSSEQLSLTNFSFDFVDRLFCHFESNIRMLDEIGFSLEASYARYYCTPPALVMVGVNDERTPLRSGRANGREVNNVVVATTVLSRFCRARDASNMLMYEDGCLVSKLNCMNSLEIDERAQLHRCRESVAANEEETVSNGGVEPDRSRCIHQPLLDFAVTRSNAEESIAPGGFVSRGVHISRISICEERNASSFDTLPRANHRTFNSNTTSAQAASCNLNTGFRTANGNSVEVHPNRVDMFKKKFFRDIFDDDKESFGSARFSSRTLDTCSFRAANGKSIYSPYRNRVNLFEDEFYNDSENEADTAPHKSAESLLTLPTQPFRKKTLYDDPNDAGSLCTSVSNFKTGSGKVINIMNANSIRISRKIYERCDDDKPSWNDGKTKAESYLTATSADEFFDLSKEITESTSAFLFDISNSETYSFEPNNFGGGGSNNGNKISEQDEKRASPILNAKPAKDRKMKRSTKTLVVPFQVVRNAHVSSLETVKVDAVPESCKRKQTGVSSTCKKRRLDETTNDSDHNVLRVRHRTNTAAQQQSYIDNKPMQFCRPVAGLYSKRIADAGELRARRPSLKEIAGHTEPKLFSLDEYFKFGLHRSVVQVTSQNARDFTFTAEFLCNQHLQDGQSAAVYGDAVPIIPNAKYEVTLEEVARGFLASPGVNPKLASSQWIANHYRWIVWKLAATERSFPTIFGGRYLTLDNLLYQLKFKYDQEIDNSGRSSLKQILEGDDSPSRPLILCVASISMMPDRLQEYRVELTDGWYSIDGQTDSEMNTLISRGKVAIGTKLLIVGAELVGWSQGCDPLQVDGKVRLKFSTNSTRRVRWWTKLGIYNNHSIPVNRVATILPNGGFVSRLSAIVARVYPILFLEKTNADVHSAHIHNEKVEFKRASMYEKERETSLEAILSQVTKEVLEENNVALTADEIKNSSDVDEEKLRCIIQERMESRLPERFSKKRNSCALLKIRLVDVANGDTSSALLSVWNPSEDTISFFKEDRRYQFHNVNAIGIRNGELQLSSTRSSRYDECSPAKFLHCSRRVTSFEELRTHASSTSAFGEVDLVGVVIKTRFDETGRFLYLADLQKHLLSVSLHPNNQYFDYGDIFTCGQVVAGVNLQWRKGFLFWKIPVVFASELTTFVCTPRTHLLQQRMGEIHSYFQSNELKSFMSECERKLRHIMNVSDASAVIPAHVSSRLLWDESPIVSLNRNPANNSFVSTGDAFINENLTTNNRYERNPTVENRTLGKIERLQNYGMSSSLSPLTLTSRTKIKKPLGLWYRRKSTNTTPSHK